jgi:chromatin structure-remodeling complex subunit RSC1/2
VGFPTFFHIAKPFDRDPETNEVLQFAAPPMHTPALKHSLAYLHFLAAKRKESGEDNGTDVDEASRTSHKRRREYVPPTVTESIGSIIADLTREG